MKRDHGFWAKDEAERDHLLQVGRNSGYNVASEKLNIMGKERIHVTWKVK